MKKITSYTLDLLAVLALVPPTLVFILLKGVYWLTVHFVEAIEKLREKLKLEGLDSPRWIDRFGELLIKGLD